MQYFTNWTVKVGKMYVSSKMMEVVSNIIFLLAYSLEIMFMEERNPYKILIIIVPKILMNILISYLSCILVSRVQSSKTMHKILVSCNLKLN